MRVAKNPLKEGERDIPSTKEEGLAELWQQERIQETQVRFNQENPPGTFLAKAQQAKEA